MTEVDDRLAALESRLQVLEDERAIADLIASYGPLVDDGAANDVANLWTDDGVYKVDDYLMNGAAAIADMVRSGDHQKLIAAGCTHFQGPVHVRVDGDSAVAVGYSLLVVFRDGRHDLARATANHWALTRTDDGWRVTRRTSRRLDGDPAAHDIVARPLRSS